MEISTSKLDMGNMALAEVLVCEAPPDALQRPVFTLAAKLLTDAFYDFCRLGQGL